MLDWGLWFERQPNSSTRVTAGLAVNGGPETLGQMIPAEGEGRFLRPGFCREESRTGWELYTWRENNILIY
jgi:hypothetical protein